MYDDYIGSQPSVAPRTAPAAPAPQVLQTLTASITTAHTAPTTTNSSPRAIEIPNTSQDVDELEPEQQHHDEENTVIRNKTRLVVGGCRQDEGIDFEESFASVARMEAIRICLADATRKSFIVFQIDVKTDFLHGSLEEDVYVYQPEGFINVDHLSHIYKLKKALFWVKASTKSMSNYVLEILKKYGMETCDPMGTSMKIKDKLDLDQNGTLVDATKYQSMIDSFKSTSGGTQLLGEKLVSWSSKKHDCTTLSAAKAEYVSLSACCAQVLWMRIQLTDYGFHFTKIPIYCDSKSAIALSCNPIQHLRTKHIVVRYYFIKEHVEKGAIELYFVKTDYQLVDLFTKALPVDRFIYLVDCLGMRSLSPHELECLAKS
nr:copia protein [Tanacetum cinerariifolium]